MIRTAQPPTSARPFRNGADELVVSTIVFGEERDGINVYARGLAGDDVGSMSGLVHHVSDPGWQHVACDAVHVHLSDRLVEDSPVEWGDVVEWTRCRGVLLVITLHDLPQHGEGDARKARRTPEVRRIASQADLIVVCSRSEQRTAAEIGIDTSVVDHPMFRAETSAESSADVVLSRSRFDDRRPTIVVAGFVHPGKGVAEMLEAVGDVRGTDIDGWELRLVGAAPDHHRDEPARLRAMAEGAGLSFHHTGAVPPRKWALELARATVAVCPHLHCSASGSILSWIAHGQRPLTSDLAFARELADEQPGCLTIVHDPTAWLKSIVNATADPVLSPHCLRTWRTTGASVETLYQMIVAALAERRTTSGGLRS